MFATSARDKFAHTTVIPSVFPPLLQSLLFRSTPHLYPQSSAPVSPSTAHLTARIRFTIPRDLTLHPITSSALAPSHLSTAVMTAAKTIGLCTLLASYLASTAAVNDVIEQPECDATKAVNIRYASSSERLYLEAAEDGQRGGCVNLTAIFEERAGKAPLYAVDPDTGDRVDEPTGTWLLTESLYVEDGITLYVSLLHQPTGHGGAKCSSYTTRIHGHLQYHVERVAVTASTRQSHMFAICPLPPFLFAPELLVACDEPTPELPDRSPSRANRWTNLG